MTKVILKIEKGSEQGRSFEFTEPDTFLVGRSKNTHFKLSYDDKTVSRRHFIIEVVPPNCFLKDLGSTNGTFVNDNRVERTQLSHGDLVKVGRTEISVALFAKEIPDIIEEEATGSIEEEREDGPKFPAACHDCTKDISDIANSDGRAEELKEIAIYLCDDCAEKRRKPADVEEIDAYRVIRELGRGGMGVVYAVLHKPTGRLLALKRILLEAADLKMKKRFGREMRIMETLKHSNIVRLLDEGIYDRDNYLVSEFLEGGDASQLITEKYRGPVPPKVACKVIVDVLKGLEYFHKTKNVHRDIKPMNMLLGRSDNNTSGTAKLADFGLAKNYSDAGGSTVTELGEVAGTVLYMPPEQILDFKNVRESGDVYSVGVSLYELLTTKYPFHFPSQLDIVMAVLQKKKVKDPILIVLEDQPIPVRKRNSDIPKALAKIVDKSIQKKIEDRFGTAAELRGEIEQVIKKI